MVWLFDSRADHHPTFPKESLDRIPGCRLHEEHDAVGGKDLNANVPRDAGEIFLFHHPFLHPDQAGPQRFHRHLLRHRLYPVLPTPFGACQ